MIPRHVVLVAYPGVQSLDLTGPLEVFAGAARLVAGRGLADPGYRVTVAGPAAAPLRTSSGLSLVPDVALADVEPPVDTLLVAGGGTARGALEDADLLAAVRAHAAHARRVASVCTGAFVLAELGLLDGRRATTHWASCSELARRYPSVTVDPEPIHVRDGRIATSAGVTAGMDLALALVEEDLGRDAALTVARWLVLFLRRPGNQAQFSAQLAAQLADRDALRELQGWIADHPAEDLSVEALADRAALSPRHFARTPETMRRSFLRALGVGPAEYRRRFCTAAAAVAAD